MNLSLCEQPRLLVVRLVHTPFFPLPWMGAGDLSRQDGRTDCIDYGIPMARSSSHDTAHVGTKLNIEDDSFSPQDLLSPAPIDRPYP
jgi:hypothetical protein